MKSRFGSAIRQVALLSAATSFISPVNAWAQSADEESAAEAEDGIIIVEARRREENVQDVPVVVNAVSGQTLERLNIRTFQDITSVVPGLQLTPNANGIGSASSLRGVNHDVNVSGENGTVQYYLNDAPVGSNIIFQAMFDIGQIEVLRGPQGTLRGRSTPSGSITIGARKPDLTQVGGYVSGTYASAGAANLNFAVNVPIISERLAIRVGGLHDFTRGDRVRSLNNPIKPRRETDALRASVLAEPTDFIKLGFLFQTLKSDVVRFDQMQSFSLLDPTAVPSAGAIDAGVINPDDRLSVSNAATTVGQSFKFYTWNAQIDFAGQSLFYVGSHSSSAFHPITAQDTTNFFPTLRPVQNTTTSATGTSHEIRIQNQERVGGIFDYVFGYFRNSGTAETFLTTSTVLRLFGQLGNGFTFSLGQPPSINDTAVFLPRGRGVEQSYFGNATVHLGDATEFSGGLRHITFNNGRPGIFISCTREKFATGTCVPASGSNGTQHFTKTVYNLTARHRFNESLMVYASTGTSWRPGVQAIGDFTTAPYTPNERAHIFGDPETSTSYEIGFKSDWFDRKLLFNMTAYQQKFQDYPFRSAAGIYFININAQGAQERGQFNFISTVPVKVDGVEAELAYNPSRHFSLATTINYSRSKIGSASLACTDALINATGATGKDGIPDLVAPTLAQLQATLGTERLAVCPGGGQAANFTPRWTGSLRAEYSLPVADGADAYLRGLFSFRGRGDNDPNNRFDNTGSYGLLNLYAGLRDPEGGWELTFFAKNIANTTQITSVGDTAISQGTVDVLLSQASGFRQPVGTQSTTFTSRYSNVTITNPREFGINLRLSFGSR